MSNFVLLTSRGNISPDLLINLSEIKSFQEITDEDNKIRTEVVMKDGESSVIVEDRIRNIYDQLGENQNEH